MVNILEDVADLIAQDTWNTRWDEGCDCLLSDLENPYDSPRVRPVAFRDPTVAVLGTSVPISFTNIAWIFVEEEVDDGQPGAPNMIVRARFLGKVNGTDDAPDSGPLVEYLRLIE